MYITSKSTKLKTAIVNEICNFIYTAMKVFMLAAPILCVACIIFQEFEFLYNYPKFILSTAN